MTRSESIEQPSPQQMIADGAADTDLPRQQVRVDAPDLSTPPVGWQAPLLDIGATIARRWQLFSLVLMLGVVVGIARYLVTRPYYEATCTAVLMPREKPAIDLKLKIGSVETSSDTATRGDTGVGMLPADVELYTSLVRSPAVLASIAKRFLPRLERFERARPETALRTVRNMVILNGDENGMMTVDVTAHDPALAADLANAIVDEIDRASKAIESKLLSQQCAHLNAALIGASERLERAETDLQGFLATHDIIDLERQTGDLLGMIRSSETDRGSLVQQRLEALAVYTETHPTVVSLDRRIAAIDAEMAAFRKRARNQDGSGGNTAQLQMEFERLRQEFDHERDMCAMLEGQHEIYQIRAQQPSGAVTSIQEAVPNPQRAGPGKKNTIGAALIIALILGVVVVMIREQWTRVAHDPYLSLRADEIRDQAKVLSPDWLVAMLQRQRRRPR